MTDPLLNVNGNRTHERIVKTQTGHGRRFDSSLLEPIGWETKSTGVAALTEASNQPSTSESLFDPDPDPSVLPHANADSMVCPTMTCPPIRRQRVHIEPEHPAISLMSRIDEPLYSAKLPRELNRSYRVLERYHAKLAGQHANRRRPRECRAPMVVPDGEPSGTGG